MINKEERPTLKQILTATCDVLFLEEADVLNKRKLGHTVEARQLFSYISYKKLRYNCTEVGKFLNRDHTTILHSSKKIEIYLETKQGDSQTYVKEILSKLGLNSLCDSTLEEKYDSLLAEYIKLKAENKSLKEQLTYE